MDPKLTSSSKDTKELEKFKDIVLKQKSIKNKDDYLNLKGDIALCSYHIDQVDQVDQVDRVDQKLDTIDNKNIIDIEKVIFEFQKMIQYNTLRIPILKNPTLKNLEKELYIESKRFMSIYHVSFPQTSQFIFVTHEDDFITMNSISKSEYSIPFFSSNKLLSPFPFSVIDYNQKTQKAKEIDIDVVPHELLSECIDIFVKKAIQKITEIQTRYQLYIAKRKRNRHNYYRELSELRDAVPLSFTSFFD
tara:strand:+ start:1501 stop:2241 length:741 start_codon:yes stop_codon:yes gene_type:complete